MGNFMPERNEAEAETEAIHTYIADMATQLSLLADQIGDASLSRSLSQVASTARPAFEKDQART